MPDLSRTEPSPLAMALGRVPSGLFILTARREGRATGMLASWVQQAGFEPPMLTVAVNRDRYVGDWIIEGGRFTLNQIPVGRKTLLRHFARGFAPEVDAFQGIAVLDKAEGGPVLADALAYLDAEVAGELSGPDHRVILARIIGGALLDPNGEPMIHVRHHGLHY
ncbi:MAG: flavin reductase family protein [Isosphaeraceae bacterium]